MCHSWIEFLAHILDEAEYLIDESNGLTYEQFVSDRTLRRAFLRSLEVMGEAAKRVPEEVRQQHPEIDWRAMAGMRDRLIHHYFGVDYELVWDVVVNKVPALAEELRRILKQESRSGSETDHQ